MLKLRYYPFLALLIAPQALAATTTTSFSVLASVNNNCSVAANDFNGPYDPTSPIPSDPTGVVTVLCTLGTSYHIRVNPGLHATTVTTRKLSNGIQTLNYGIFRDAARTLNWGETDGVDTVDSTGTGIAQSFTAYGRTPPLQNVPPGVYTDTLTVTVSF